MGIWWKLGLFTLQLQVFYVKDLSRVEGTNFYAHFKYIELYKSALKKKMFSMLGQEQTLMLRIRDPIVLHVNDVL